MPLLVYKQRDPVPNWPNTPASNFGHVKYIATRPKVLLNPHSNHGLFGNAESGEVAPIESLHKMQQLVLEKSREKKNIHRGVISFSAETAKELDLNRREDFERLVKYNMHILAEKNHIKIQNLRWVAAAHFEPHHPHVHIMFWDAGQTMTQNYVSPEIPNAIRKDLIKNIFAAELTDYYENKQQTTVSLRQITNEMVEEFEKAITDLKPKQYKDLKELTENDELFSCRFSADFDQKELVSLAKELFLLRKKLPKKGRLNFDFLDREAKDEMLKFVDNLINSNEQLKLALGLYIDSRLNITEMYTYNIIAYEKATKEYSDEAKKLIANRILRAVKTIGDKEFILKNHEYRKHMARAFVKELMFGVFGFLGKEIRVNQRGRKSRLVFSTELSKQAQIEKAKELESAGGDWGDGYGW